MSKGVGTVKTSSDAISCPKSKGVAKMSRKKKAEKKMMPGSSNWAKLCSEMKRDPNKRKKADTEEVKSDVSSVSSSSKSIKKTSQQDIWFDNVDEILLDRVSEATDSAESKLVKADSFPGVTKCVAMDCEMVGVGPDGQESILARVSLVNHFGVCLYDKFVLPREPVTDYRTHVSGVTKEILDEKGEPFEEVQKAVSDLLKGRILVGHALQNDLRVLYLSHPKSDIRDTCRYKPFRTLFNGCLPSLKKLTEKVLGVKVQEGQHSSVQDAQAAMRLYTFHRQKWEAELNARSFLRRRKKAKAKKTKSASKPIQTQALKQTK